MIDLHPTFDPETETWFVDEYKVDAASIRELIKKLPPRSRIVDYYPNGDFRAPPWPKTVVKKILPPTPAPRPIVAKPILAGPPAPAREVEEKVNAVMDAWARNDLTGDIVTACSLSGVNELILMVKEAKALGDPRALVSRSLTRKRAGREVGEGRKYDHEAILDMWAHGSSSMEICLCLGITVKSAVGTVLAAARRRKDPRSTLRGTGNRPSMK